MLARSKFGRAVLRHVLVEAASFLLFASVPFLASGTAAAQDKPKVEVVAQAGHQNEVCSVAFSHDGRTALSGSRDQALKLWDVATGKLLRTFSGHSGTVSSVAFSPDGRTALSGSIAALTLWDVATGKFLRIFEVNSQPVWSVAFSPDGATALSGGDDKTLKLRNVASVRLLRTFAGHSGAVSSVAFSPDGRTALSGSDDKTLKLWDEMWPERGNLAPRSPYFMP